MFSLREDGYARALHYKLTFNAERIGEEETRLLQSRIHKRNRAEEQSLLGSDLERRVGIQLFDGVRDWSPVVYAYWKTVAWTLH